MDFAFFNVERIHLFTSNFVDICSDHSYPFVFPSKRKLLPLDSLKKNVTALSNQDKKVAFIQVDGDGSLERSYWFMKICHNMNIIVQTIGGDAYSINGKSEIPNNTLYNVTRALLVNSSNKK